MIIFLILILILSLTVNVFMIILIKKLIIKNDIYESWILGFKQDITESIETMREIDKQGTFATSLNDKGIFESDDQVGQIFKEIIGVIEDLNEKIK